MKQLIIIIHNPSPPAKKCIKSNLIASDILWLCLIVSTLLVIQPFRPFPKFCHWFLKRNPFSIRGPCDLRWTIAVVNHGSNKAEPMENSLNIDIETRWKTTPLRINISKLRNQQKTSIETRMEQRWKHMETPYLWVSASSFSCGLRRTATAHRLPRCCLMVSTFEPATCTVPWGANWISITLW
jgi:hypothetical protein